jgi:hypothetical protein
MGVHPLDLIPLEAPGRALGLEALPVRERRRPQMPNESGRTSSGASSPSRSPTPASAPGGSARSSRARSGVAQDLGQRHLALPAPGRAQHPHPKAEPGRRLPRPLRAEASRAPVRAARRGLPPERIGVDCFYVGCLSGTKGAVLSPASSHGGRFRNRVVALLGSAGRGGDSSRPFPAARHG